MTLRHGGNQSVNTATSTEAAPAKRETVNGLIEVRLTAIRYAARDTNPTSSLRSMESRCRPISRAHTSTCICPTG
jgi:hypothetical protein